MSQISTALHPNKIAESAAAHFTNNNLDEAMKQASAALLLDANCAVAHLVVGLVHAARQQLDQAVASMTRALEAQPDLVRCHCHLGNVYNTLGRQDLGMECFKRALLIAPDDVTTRFNRAINLLQAGEFEEGWLEYEWRWRTGQVGRPDIPRPRWDGSDPKGKTILVHSEQGMGDTMQYIRFLPMLKDLGVDVHFACNKPLQPLLRTIKGVDEWFPIDQEAKIKFDWFTPMMSLTYLLKINSEAAIPKDVPYIFPDPDLIQKWRPRINDLPGFKIGLNWQGSPTHINDGRRSIPLSKYAPLANVDGVSLVSLQKVAGEEQILANKDAIPMTVFDGMDQDGAFTDTAAIMQHLDLVITSDTAIAHLAGALGRPVWVMLSVGPDWRFMLNRSDNPWYPTMRVFRQKEFGDWDGVFDEVCTALKQETAN